MDNWLFRRAAASPDQIGLTEGVDTWTFADMAREASRRAQWLRGHTDGTRVGVLARTSAQTYLWILGVLTSGKQVVLLNPRLTSRELAPQVARAGLDTVLCDAKSLTLVGELGVAMFAPATSAATWDGPLPTWDSARVASVIFTSGTTGRPKGVLGSFGNHWSSALASATNLGHSQESWICALPLCHVSGFSMLCKGLIYGATVHVLPKFEAAQANHLLESGRAGFMSVVPTMLADMLTHLDGRRYPPTVRALLLGGSPVPAALLTAAQRVGAPVVFSYGMTETASHVVALPPHRRTEAPGSSGLPLLSTQVRTVDGRLQVRAPSVCVGYLDDDVAYRAAWTEDGWFKTGDLAEIDDDGFIHILARETELIVTGGENVYPGEVERVIRALEGVHDVVVVGIPHERWSFVPVALVEGDVSHDAVRAHCERELAAYKCPRRVVSAEIPRTVIGKPDIQAVRRLFATE